MKLRTLSDQSLIILAIIGVIIFFSIQFIPGFTEEVLEAQPGEQLVSKQEALDIADQWVSHNMPSMQSDGFVMLQADQMLNSYLQKQKLMPSFSKAYSQRLAIEFYQVEYNHSGYQLAVNIHQKNGTVLGWYYTKAGADPTPSGTSEFNDAAAQQLIEDKLEQLDFNMNQWSLIESPEEQGSIYRYQYKDFLGEAELYIEAVFSDSKMVSFQPVYEIPESHQTWMAAQDQKMEKMQLLSLLITLLFFMIAIVLAIIYRNTVSFSRGIILSLIYLITASISNFNMYPAFRAMYMGEANSETSAHFLLWLQQIFTIGTAILLYFAFVVGEGFWRSWNHSLWPRWRESHKGNHVLGAMGRGYLFCLMILGVQQILFGVGHRYFDVWSISDPLFSTYNLIYPIFFPVLAWAAAISEEAIYRLFGLAIFKKLFRSTLIAALLSSMIWAFGHTAYPIYPAYTRFIEVTILGLIFCYIFLKYGLYTAIFAHAAVDCILMGVSIMFMGEAQHVLSGLFFIASPALFGYLIYWLHQRWGLFRPREPRESS